MFVRMKIGKCIGEIRDVAFDAARDLIASGRAEKLNFDSSDEQSQLQAPVVQVADTPAVEAVKKTVSRRSRPR